ncbi:MAG: OmpA family protein [Acidobacteria bacterium]|nr:OmpA family protein [Acidobacteriota bacterium]MBV9478628.1 OmpA family protein [Acidobacteriota bacterium]
MKKLSNILLTSLAVVLIVLAPACRSKKKNIPPVVTPSDTSASAPDVAPPPATNTGTTVAPPTDFVDETPKPVEETLPADIEQLNRYVQQKGYLRDAFYNYDEATLDDAAQSALSASATWLKSKDGAGYNLLVEGHCDERGTEQYNLALGDRRANSAKDYLVTLGVDSGRIRTVSYGEERPFDEGHEDSAWAKNRRAHLVLVR